MKDEKKKGGELAFILHPSSFILHPFEGAQVSHRDSYG